MTFTTTYDFDTLIERHNTGSAKWDWFGEALPMWVADMDFRSPEPILKALHERVDHGVFGYGFNSPRLRDILVERMASRYDWSITAGEIEFLPNLVSALNIASRAYAEPGNSVLMLTPAYPPFLSAPTNGGRERVLPELTARKKGQILYYEMDFDAIEASITSDTKLLLLCNPHNPVGREWTRNELERLAEICLRHDLIICSDEIHCDLLFAGTQHTPFASLDPEISARTVTLMAPSKTYNMPTLGLGFAITQNEDLLARFKKEMMGIVPHPGALGFAAAEAAYSDPSCQEWLDALLVYLEGNRNYLVRYVEEHFPTVSITRPEATYLAWMDWREAGISGSPFQFFLDEAKVAFNNGADFGQPGEGFLRINFGCPRSMLIEALERVGSATKHL